MVQLARWIPPKMMIATGTGAAALVLLAACGAGQSSYGVPAAAAPAASANLVPSGYAAPPAPAPASAAPAPAAATGAADAPVAANTVMIQNFAFAPAIVTVKAGTTITWTNQDQDAHTVTSPTGPLKSPTLSNGQSFHYTFTTAGRFDYICTIHPFMTATVVVTP